MFEKFSAGTNTPQFGTQFESRVVGTWRFAVGDFNGAAGMLVLDWSDCEFLKAGRMD
jgi:hypothetical protein